MPAYLISRLVVTNPERFDLYRKASMPIAARYGARYLARTDAVECLEGSYDGRRMVIIEFPNMEALRSFYHSEAYQEARKLREGASVHDMWAVDGGP